MYPLAIFRVLRRRDDPTGIRWAALWLVITLSLIAWLTFFVVAISANGNAVEIFRGREGPYEITVGILPEIPLVGTVHFSVNPVDSTTLNPVTRAEIVLIADNPDGTPTFQARSLNTPATPQYYEANITFASAGSWTIRVRIIDDQLGEATFRVPLELGVQSLTPNPFGGIVLLIAFLAIVGGVVYLWWSARRRNRIRNA